MYIYIYNMQGRGIFNNPNLAYNGDYASLYFGFSLSPLLPPCDQVYQLRESSSSYSSLNVRPPERKPEDSISSRSHYLTLNLYGE